MVGTRGCAIALMVWSAVSSAAAASGELQAQAQLLMKSPDVTISGTYELPTRPDILDRILRSPILLARLWEAYQFPPAYKARLQGDGIHIDDPTGITGDIFPVEQTGNRRTYVGIGTLNHRLVPAFQGKMAVVLSTIPKGTAVSARVDIYVRTDSRLLGFLASTMFPLLRARVEYRINANVTDIGTILKDLSNEPQKTIALLKKEDAAALLKIMPAQPPPPAVKK
jgi:hypothetical protein